MLTTRLVTTYVIRIRQAAGQSVKSALSHTLVHDSRDNTVMGSKGLFAKLIQVSQIFLPIQPLPRVSRNRSIFNVDKVNI